MKPRLYLAYLLSLALVAVGLATSQAFAAGSARDISQAEDLSSTVTGRPVCDPPEVCTAPSVHAEAALSGKGSYLPTDRFRGGAVVLVVPPAGGPKGRLGPRETVKGSCHSLVVEHVRLQI